MGRMTLQVDVTDLAETMDFAVPDGMSAYLDLRTGAVHVPEAAPHAGGDEHLLEIPPFDRRHRHDTMMLFVATLDAELRTVFEMSLDGQGALRRFKNLVNQHGIAEAWRGFQLRADRAEALAWLAREGIDVIDVSTRVPPAPDEQVGTPIRLVDVLLLGAPGGKTELLEGQVLRRIAARSPDESRELFRSLAGAIASETGATLPGSTGATDRPPPTDTLDAGRFHLRRRDDAVELAVDVAPAVWDRFAG